MSGSHFQGERDREEFIFQCVEYVTNKMLARNMEISGRIPRQTVKLSFFPPTHFHPGSSTCLSPLQLLDWLILGNGLRLGRGLLQNTIPWGSRNSGYPSQT